MRTVRILLAILVVFCIVVFGALIQSRMRGKRFAMITPGATEGDALSRLGPPSRTMPCVSLPEPPEHCTRVLVYSGPFSSVMPEFWLFPLDPNSRVLRILHTTRAD